MTQGTDEFNRTMDSMESIYSENASKMESATKKIQNGLTKLGDVVLPLLGQLFEKIGNIADKFSNLDSSVQKIIVIIALIVATIGPLLLLIGGISTRIIYYDWTFYCYVYTSTNYYRCNNITNCNHSISLDY